MKQRKNIFEIINSYHNPLQEIKRIDNLLLDNNGVYVKDDQFFTLTDSTPNSIVKYIDDYLFKGWAARGTCICTSDMKTVLGIGIIPDEDEICENIEFVLRYCEYAANMVYLCKK